MKTIDGVEITEKSKVYATNNLLNYENMKIFVLKGKDLCHCSTFWVKCFSTRRFCQDFIDRQKPE